MMRQPEASNGWALPCARLAVCLAVAGTWLSFSVLQQAAYSLPKLVALSGACFAAWALLAAARDALEPYPTPLDRPLACLAAVALVSAWLGGDPVLGLIGRHRFYAYGLLAFGLYIAAYYAAAWSKPEGEPLALLRTVAAAGGLAGLYGVAQAAGVEPFAGVAPNLPEGRVISTMGSPVYLGACLLMAVPVALHLGLSTATLDRVIGRAAGAAALAALALTFSRGAWIGAAGGVLAYLGWTGRLRIAATRWVALGVGALALACAVLGGSLLRRSAAASDSMRLQLWASAWSVARESPWLGTGPDNFEAALRRNKTAGFVRVTGGRIGQANAHNDLLQALATLGLAGLAAYLWVLWAAGRMLHGGLADPATRGVSAAAGGALLGLFVQAKVNPTPVPSLAAAAVLCGVLARRAPGHKAAALRWRPPALALACAGALALTLRLALADRHALRAGVFQAVGRMELAAREFPAAIRLHPYETDYRIAYGRFLIGGAGRAADPAERLRLLETAVGAGEEAVRLRPGHVDAHQLLGAALLELRRAGGSDRLDEAERALDRALELDPTFPQSLENRMLLARFKGDVGLVQELKSRLRDLQRR